MNKLKKFLPYLILLGITFFLFFEFFAKGYVLEGHFDRRDQLVPFQLFFLRSFQSFQIPQWNPYIFCGTSAFANITSTFFYPGNWLAYILPERYLPLALTIISIFNFFFAGYFTYILLKKLTNDSYWALCGTFTYLLSTPTVLAMTLGVSIFTPFVYLPLLLYLVYTFQERTLLSNTLLHAITLSLLLLGGAIQQTGYVIGLYLFFALFLGIKGTSKRIFTVRPFCMMLLSVLFAIAIASVRYLPTYYFMSENLQEKVSYSQFLQIAITPPIALLKIFLPQFFGDGLTSPFLLRKWNLHEIFFCYIGTCGIFLSLYAILFIWKKHTLVWKIAVLLIFLLILGTPLAYFHYIATGKTIAFFCRIAWMLPLFLAVLFSFAGKELMQIEGHRTKFIIFALCLFMGTLLFALVAYRFVKVQEGALPLESLAVMKSSVAHFLAISLILIGLVLFLVVAKSTSKHIIFKTLFSIIMVADLLFIAKINYSNGFFIDTFLAPQPFFQHSSEEKSIKREFMSDRNFRILGNSIGTLHNINVHLGVYNSSGYDNAPPYFIAKLYKYPKPLNRGLDRWVRPLSNRVAQLTATKYTVYSDGFTVVASSLPRFRLYNNYIIIESEEETLQKLHDQDFDIQNIVVLSEQPNLAVTNSDVIGEIHLIEETFNTLIFEVETEKNALLLLNDTYDDGWKVWIDNQLDNIIRANYAFRVVTIPKGKHTLRFKFTQKGLKEGIWITMIAMGIFLVLGLILFRSSFH